MLHNGWMSVFLQAYIRKKYEFCAALLPKRGKRRKKIYLEIKGKFEWQKKFI